ncbi:hypothetical protein J6590_017515 [Homalodisca vitripennis]|nr:hypothetical protein J6590_017515 [Homalodisca vitripennis]
MLRIPDIRAVKCLQLIAEDRGLGQLVGDDYHTGAARRVVVGTETEWAEHAFSLWSEEESSRGVDRREPSLSMEVTKPMSHNSRIVWLCRQYLSLLDINNRSPPFHSIPSNLKIRLYAPSLSMRDNSLRRKHLTFERQCSLTAALTGISPPLGPRLPNILAFSNVALPRDELVSNLQWSAFDIPTPPTLPTCIFFQGDVIEVVPVITIHGISTGGGLYPNLTYLEYPVTPESAQMPFKD